MKYTSQVTINLPRARVIELFDNPDNLKLWQEGLQSFEHVSGTAGEPGAKSKLVYATDRRRIEMIETVTLRDLPDAFNGTYDAQGVHNIQNNRFIEDGPERTRWVSESEFQFSGFMRLLSPFIQGSIRKESQKLLEDFKAFAEGQGPG